MKQNKAIARKQLRMAHHTTLRNHSYVLYDNNPNLKVVPAFNNKVIIQGERASGKTVALAEMALDLVRSTPAPLKGKRHLLWIYVFDNYIDVYWQLLYSMLLSSVPGKEIVGPRTSEKAVKDCMKGYGFDVAITGHEFESVDTTQYEVVHMLRDGGAYDQMPYVENVGVRVTTHDIYKREGCSAISGCSIRNLLRTSVLIEVSKHTDGDSNGQIKGTVLKSPQRDACIEQFTIAFLPGTKNTNHD